MAGVLVAAVGEGWCFLLDTVSYGAVIVSLLMMTVARRERAEAPARVRDDLASGVAYAVGSPPIRAGLALLAVVSFAGMPYTVLMPVVAKNVLGGGANTLGALMAASGLGALGGALYLASRSSIVGLGRVIPAAAAVFGGSLVAFAFSRSLLLSLGLLVIGGAGFMIQMASTNTVLQTIVRDEMRGRVMAFYTMAFMGMAPFGSLLAGLLADRIGTPWTIAAGGACCVLGAAVFARTLPVLREHVVPVYREKGILPAIAAGLGDATALRQGVQR